MVNVCKGLSHSNLAATPHTKLLSNHPDNKHPNGLSLTNLFSTALVNFLTNDSSSGTFAFTHGEIFGNVYREWKNISGSLSVGFFCR
jgi:hypothetical protein